ncbi:MAG: (d)CMP kinase [Clostridiales bacterium]|nr:(d)CMP kinase [Clostridiales bacterium]
MIAIRGAITVNEDCVEQIKEAVNQMLSEIVSKNGLKQDDIICIMLSNTADIKSYYPAKAAREIGFSNCALYSSLEPEIDGSLKLCIRVMLLVEKQIKPVHVYLKGAKSLRKDITSKLNIALDGPAGSGKSTVAKILAKDFDILYLDTGAMYRACALDCIAKNVDFDNESSVFNAVSSLNLQIEYKDGKQITLLNGEDVSEKIRQPHVSNLASKVSAYGFVRQKLVEMQRSIASKISCVLDGRDIGTFVLPNAEHKFFLTATAEIRAERRFIENKEKGFSVDYEDILNEIKERDKRDSEREIAPLKQADDAILVDTSQMSIDEVVQFIKNKIQEKI